MFHQLKHAWAWNPGFARLRLLQILVLLLASDVLDRALSQVAFLKPGPLGGISSWIVAALILVFTVVIFGRFFRELRAAEKLLKSDQLPCTRCGYPLAHEPSPTCPECGTTQTWPQAIQYWKNRNVVNPLQITPPPDYPDATTTCPRVNPN